ncbi:MAG: radical SAM protein [Acidobacteriota bacterium]
MWTTNTVRSILTRTSGYLATVTSHSAQPYRGCALGHSLCGVGCYVRHNPWVTRGQAWGDFVEARVNAADAYREHVDRERRWARKHRGGFSIFLSSATEPFQPLERRAGVTRALLQAMLDQPPDELVIQTHSHRVLEARDGLEALAKRCRLRVHLSIETDRECLPSLPPHGSPLERRFEAARQLREAGLQVVITVSPLLPIADPDTFFARIAQVADAVVLDHFIGGDGTPDGRRTRKTPLVAAMAAIDPASVEIGYRDRMETVARRYVERVGVGIDGFAGRM